jgi:anti-sigma factor (TIGR02949 family)
MSERRDPNHPDEIGCLEAIESLYAYLDGELDDAESVVKVEQHLAHCRSCYSRSQLERRLAERLKAAGHSSAPTGLQARLRRLMGEF